MYQKVIKTLYFICSLCVISWSITVELSPVPISAGSAEGLSKGGISSPVGAEYNCLYVRPLHSADDISVDPLPVSISLANNSNISRKVKVYLRAKDPFGQQLSWYRELVVELPANGTSVQVFDFKGGTGYYTIVADIVELDAKTGMAKSSGIQRNAAELGVASIPPAWPGRRYEGMFMINQHGWDFKFYKTIGYHLTRIAPDEPWRDALKEDLVPYIIYDSDPDESKSRTALDNLIKKLLGELNTLDTKITLQEFVNEPWIFGWRWQNTAAEYRYFQKEFLTKAKQARPAIRFSACSSIMLFTDVVEGWEECWKGLMDGVANHPYNPSTNLPTGRPGELHSDLDACQVVCRRTGMERYYITEGGQWGDNTVETAYKIVQIHATEAIAGAFTSCNETGIGTGPGLGTANTAFAVFSFMTTDRPCVADIYPYSELLWGAIFANKRHITDEVKALPRAEDIKSRWEVEPLPDKANDNTKVAVLWCNTGASNLAVDTDGKLIIEDASSIKAYTMLGAEIKPSGSTLTVNFTQAPVYLTTENLTVVQLRDKIRSAKITGVTPVNMYALSLGKPADEPQQLIVRIQNQMPFGVEGTITVEPQGGQTTSAPFTIAEGRLREVKVDWKGVTLNKNNVYVVKLTATVKDSRSGENMNTVTRTHCINSAIIAQKNGITVDGNLDDWSGVVPVTLSSDQAKSWSAATPSIGGENSDIFAKVYVAYDNRYVYVAADIKEPSFGCLAGQPGPAGLPQGLPGGIYTITRQGDAFSFAFGFRHRVPHLKGRDLNEPWCWKGHYYDTDYLYTAHTSTLGDMLVQHWDAESPRRWGYQTDNLPEHKKVPGGLIKISRGGTTIYEIAIPRSEISLFDPAKMDACRFSFIVINGEKAAAIYYDNKDDMNFNMQYSRGYGVFDHWNKMLSSFGPSWNPMQPCQTRFAIQGGTFNPAQELPEQTPTLSGSVSIGAVKHDMNTGGSVINISVPSREKVLGRNRM